MRNIFFYESQLGNRDSTVRLYAEPGNSEASRTRELILAAPITEDLIMNIGNSFSDDGGGFISDTVQGGYDSFRKSSPIISEALGFIGKTAGANSMTGGISNHLKSFVNTNSNKALKTYADRVRFFQGTEVNFGIPFRAVIYNNSYFDSNGQPMSSLRALDRLIDRCVGDIEGIGGADSGLSKYFAFQNSPNGYTAQIAKFVDEERDLPPGTFTVEYGDLYVIKGLLVEGLSVTMSKNKLKRAPGATGPKLPLYVEVDVQVSPALDYLKTNLQSFLNIK